MKVILTGPTGFIGSEVLTQLLAHPTITSIIAVSRRPLPTTNPKLKTVLLQDFTAWPSPILDECAGADACIWALGLASADVEKNKLINRDYTLAGCRALFNMSKQQQQQGQKKKLNFVYTSGFLAEKDQGRNLWFMSEARKVRGELENQLVELGKQYTDAGATYIVRPGFALKKDAGSVTGAVMSAGGMVPTVKAHELAATMIETALDGSDRQIWEHKDLVSSGREALSKAA